MGKSRTGLKIVSIIFLIISLVNLAFVTSLTYITPLLLIVDLILSIFWICKWKKFLIIPLIALISQLFFIPSLLHFSSLNLPYINSNSIKVASYNVNAFSYNNGHNAKDILSVLEKESVDIICFQEFVPSSSFTNYNHSCIQKKEKEYNSRLALFSRYPIVNSQEELFLNGINSAMYADLIIDDQTVRVINCHLQTTGVTQNRKYGYQRVFSMMKRNNLVRKQQAQYLERIVRDSPYPTILCGDFNDTPLSYSYRLISRAISDGYRKAGDGNSSTFIGGFKNLLRIDYIFNSKELKCSDYFISDYIFSDHKMVISILEYKN